MINITPEEAKLVRALLKYWEAGSPIGHHTGCECEQCETWNEAGEHEASTFTNLQEKVEHGDTY